MNKAVNKRLDDLAAAISRHEEAVEQKFNQKTVAIVKYRTGLEGGRKHELAETAAYFKVSTTWVGKAMRDVTAYCEELDKQTPKATETVGNATVTPLVATIQDGRVKVEGGNKLLAAEVQSDLQVMLDQQAKQAKGLQEIARQAKEAQDNMSLRHVVAFFTILVGIVVAYVTIVKAPELSQLRIGIGSVAGGAAITYGLGVYRAAVRWEGKRNGLLEAARLIKGV